MPKGKQDFVDDCERVYTLMFCLALHIFNMPISWRLFLYIQHIPKCCGYNMHTTTSKTSWLVGSWGFLYSHSLNVSNINQANVS